MTTQTGQKTPSIPVPKLKRGCGFRIAGGIYATATGTLEYDPNIPMKQFLQCPPMPIDPNDIGLAAQGVLIKEGTPYGRKGKWDLFDWVGTSGYPYIPDFIEEGQRYGFSRRVPKSAPIHLLNNESLHIMGHPRAILQNSYEFYKNRLSLQPCPKGHETHNSSDENAESCLGLLYEAISRVPENLDDRVMTRVFPIDDENAFTYAGGFPIEEPDWQFGIFMTMQITAFEVIEDPFSDSDQAAMELLLNSGTNIPYYLVEA